jgi:predicted nucleic acid-binding protein
MIALDTNVLARFLLADDDAQLDAAKRLLARRDEQFLIPITVILELAWVLRKRGVPRAKMVDELRRLLALPGMQAQMPEAIARAFEWSEHGFDVADALHLALSAKADQFATFDEELDARSRRTGVGLPVFFP